MNNIKICVVTILIGDLLYKERAKINHKKYCDKHGYTYVCLEKSINGFHPMWMKPDIILSEFNNNYDYVFWMDGDSFFINMDISLKKFTDLNKDLVATGDENDIINTGHLLFKNSGWSLLFIKKWIKFRQILTIDNITKFKLVTTHFTTFDNNIFFNDQPPINLMLSGASEKNQSNWFDLFNNINLYPGNTYKKYGIEYSPTKDENMDRANSLIIPEFRQHVGIVIQSAMNSYPSTYNKGDFIIHFVSDKWQFNQILDIIEK